MNDHLDDFFGLDVPFARFCGIRALGVENGRTRLMLPMSAEGTNHFGVFHGGALMTLLDIAMGSAARVHSGAWVVAVDMQTAFVAPGRGDVIGEGFVIRAGHSLIFCDGEVRDTAGNLIAKGSGVYKIARKSKTES